eukprot:1160884-Pelagomonas_calceolata.AAC.13
MLRKETRNEELHGLSLAASLRKGHLSSKAVPHHTDQEEQQAHRSTPASCPPPWDLQQDCQAGPVQQAQDPPP